MTIFNFELINNQTGEVLYISHSMENCLFEAVELITDDYNPDNLTLREESKGNGDLNVKFSYWSGWLFWLNYQIQSKADDKLVVLYVKNYLTTYSCVTLGSIHGIASEQYQKEKNRRYSMISAEFENMTYYFLGEESCGDRTTRIL